MTSSPFPGMDPYLEPHWLDVHTKLVTYAADDLNTRIPDALYARAQERIAVESGADRPHLFSPDVRVLERVERDTAVGVGTTTSAAQGQTILAPYRLVAMLDPIVERYIEVLENESDRLVTVIEFFSPTNKRGGGLREFRRKRGKLLASGVNFVEIDLVRAGRWRKLLAPHLCPPEAVTPYRATIRVAADLEGGVHLFPIPLRTPLPTIPVPLRANDSPDQLDLQSLVARAYHNGRYGQSLIYARPLRPPLEPADAEWSDQLLDAAGRR